MTSALLVSLGIIITILFDRHYDDNKIASLNKELLLVEDNVYNYKMQQDGSREQLKEILKMIDIANNMDSVLVDNVGYVYMTNGEEYENLKLTKIDFDFSSIEYDDELTYVRNLELDDDLDKVDCYVEKLYAKDEFAGYILLMPKVDESRTRMKGIIWLAVFIEIIISMAIVKFITQTLIVKPIEVLNNAARRLAKGEVERRVEVKYNNEIGELGESFNIMAESLEAADIKRTEFISNVSHELRSPITSIKGFVGGILDGVIPKDKENYYLKIVYDEIDRLARLVNDLLDISAMEAGKFNLSITEFDINQVISLCILNLEHKIQLKGLNVKVVFHEKRCYVSADRDRIIQVVTNILENAIKYSNDNGEIEINVMYKSGKIMVEIFNSGENINEKDINHIWDRFYKSDKSRTNKISTGLGLPIVRLILSQHNEDIWVKNIPGKGVKFIFTLSKSH